MERNVRMELNVERECWKIILKLNVEIKCWSGILEWNVGMEGNIMLNQNVRTECNVGTESLSILFHFNILF